MFSIFNFMKFLEPISVSRISSLLDIPFFGDGEKLVYGLNEINLCKEGDIVFVNHPKYQAKAELSKATAIITKVTVRSLISICLSSKQNHHLISN